ncbi:MAG: nicotinate (nicotinamide) nucleotide adenylyltransferase [Pseudomonadota bacterium]|nr:nicotinate (nicotinamide) nucleotide adenylyltransferase [Pseudomonadota bacterium]
MSDTIGIFGGAFDPVHKGHVSSIIELKDKLDFSDLKIIPFNIPAQKETTLASNSEILKMLKLDFDEFYNINIDSFELDKKGISYTVDTLEAITKKSKAGQHLTLIMGLDAFINLTSWKNYERILELSSILILKRPNYELKKNYLAKFERELTDDLEIFLNSKGKIILFTLTQLDISSSEIKKAIKNNKSCEDYLDKKVLEFINDKSIYK